MARPAVLTAAALLAAGLPVTVAETGAHAGGGQGWAMRHHSFMRTMSYDDTLGDWLSSAGTMALRDRVQLLPPVGNRYGAFWSKQAITTKDFEVSFTLSALPSGRGTQDAAFAFWISEQDVSKDYNEQVIVTTSKDWLEGSTKAGMTLLQNRPSFKGLASVMLATPGEDMTKQYASTVYNDGKELTLEDFRKGSADKGMQKKDTYFAWSSSATQMKIRVKPDGSIKGQFLALEAKEHIADTTWVYKHDGINAALYISFLKDGRVRVNAGTPDGKWQVHPGGRIGIQAPSVPLSRLIFRGAYVLVPEQAPRTEQTRVEYIGPMKPTGDEPEVHDEDHLWNEFFNFPAGTFKGEECYLGFTGWSGTISPTEVDLHELHSLNFDASKVGEQDGDLLGESQSEWLKVLEEEKRFLDQASQTEAVARLTKLLTEHVEKYNQLGEHVQKELIKLDQRVEDLNAGITAFHSMAQAWVFESQSFDPKVVRDHLVGIHTLLTKGEKDHSSLDAVSAAAAQLKARHGAAQLNDDGKAKVEAVAELSKSVEDLAEKGSTQTNWLLLMMVVAVAGLGLLFLNRMRYYEKKHYI